MTALDGLTVAVRARRHRAYRRQRRGQVDPDQDPPRPARAHPGHGEGARPRLRQGRQSDPAARRLHARARLPATGHHGDRVRHAHGPHVRPPGHRRAGAGRRGAAPRRPARGALPADRHLLHRHEAAGEARPGPRRRPAAAAARRADQRPRPGGPQRDARADRADRRRSSASRSWSRATCSARSSGSATASSRSRRAGCCAPTRWTASPGRARRCSSRWKRAPPRCATNSPGAACTPGPTSGPCWSPSRATHTYDAVRDSVAALGLPLSRLEQRRHQVEEIFRDDEPGQQGQFDEMEAADAH